jgi:hypothetical protein
MGKFSKVFINDLGRTPWTSLICVVEIKGSYLKFNPSTCEYSINNIGFLGHSVDKEETKLDQWKVKGIIEFLVPTFVTNVKAFLGLTSYYKNYVKGYSCIVMPLFELERRIQCFCGPPNVKMHWLRHPFLLR